MQKRFTCILTLILCVLFIEGCGLFHSSADLRLYSSGLVLDADSDIPKKIGIISFYTSRPPSNKDKDQFSKQLKKLGFDVVEIDEFRDLPRVYGSDYSSDYFKEFREKLKEFGVKAFFVGSGVIHRDTEDIRVDLIDVETGRVIWSATCQRVLHYWSFFSPNIRDFRKITRQLESDIESHNKARKSKAK